MWGRGLGGEAVPGQVWHLVCNWELKSVKSESISEPPKRLCIPDGVERYCSGECRIATTGTARGLW